MQSGAKPALCADEDKHFYNDPGWFFRPGSILLANLWSNDDQSQIKAIALQYFAVYLFFTTDISFD